MGGLDCLIIGGARSSTMAMDFQGTHALEANLGFWVGSQDTVIVEDWSAT
jgi:hypothetical protein